MSEYCQASARSNVSGINPVGQSMWDAARHTGEIVRQQEWRADGTTSHLVERADLQQGRLQEEIANSVGGCRSADCRPARAVPPPSGLRREPMTTTSYPLDILTSPATGDEKDFVLWRYCKECHVAGRFCRHPHDRQMSLYGPRTAASACVPGPHPGGISLAATGMSYDEALAQTPLVRALTSMSIGYRI